MSKKTLRFPEFSENPDAREALVGRVVKNAEDLYLAKVATDSQQDFIAANYKGFSNDRYFAGMGITGIGLQ